MVRATAVTLVSLVAGAVLWLALGGRMASAWVEPLSLFVVGVAMCGGSVLFLSNEPVKESKPATDAPAMEPQRATA